MAFTHNVTLLMTLSAAVESQALPVNWRTQTTTSCPDKSSRSRSTSSSTSPIPPGFAAPVSRKRKRTGPWDDQSSCTLDAGTILAGASEKRHASSRFVGIQPPPLIYPKSLYSSLKPPFPRTKEKHVLQEILVSYNGYGCFVQPLILLLGGRSKSFSLGRRRLYLCGIKRFFDLPPSSGLGSESE